MAFAAARMILKDKRRKSKEDFAPPPRQRSKVDLYIFMYKFLFVILLQFSPFFVIEMCDKFFQLFMCNARKHIKPISLLTTNNHRKCRNIIYLLQQKKIDLLLGKYI